MAYRPSLVRPPPRQDRRALLEARMQRQALIRALVERISTMLATIPRPDPRQAAANLPAHVFPQGPSRFLGPQAGLPQGPDRPVAQFPSGPRPTFRPTFVPPPSGLPPPSMSRGWQRAEY